MTSFLREETDCSEEVRLCAIIRRRDSAHCRQPKSNINMDDVLHLLLGTPRPPPEDAATSGRTAVNDSESGHGSVIHASTLEGGGGNIMNLPFVTRLVRRLYDRADESDNDDVHLEDNTVLDEHSITCLASDGDYTDSDFESEGATAQRLAMQGRPRNGNRPPTLPRTPSIPPPVPRPVQVITGTPTVSPSPPSAVEGLPLDTHSQPPLGGGPMSVPTSAGVSRNLFGQFIVTAGLPDDPGTQTGATTRRRSKAAPTEQAALPGRVLRSKGHDDAEKENLVPTKRTLTQPARPPPGRAASSKQYKRPS